jgi:transposase InsO family protein
VNVDLCFVPWEHPAEERLPAVSGSSGHLVVAHRPSQGAAPFWPGQVFAEADLPYAEAMQRYVAQTRDRLVRQKLAPREPEREPAAWRQEKAVQAERHQVVQCRLREDAAWRVERQEHHRIVVAYRALSQRRRLEQAAIWQAHKQHWAKRRQARAALVAARKAENQRWHAANQTRRQTPPPRWIAVLVVTDTATRQGLGLPLFANGAHLTAAEVAAALGTLLPANLAFLISDQGTHFRSRALAQLAQARGFVHVPIFRHRPQTNGIAERFVRTLKQDLRWLSWSGPQELRRLLDDFLPWYNDRPHQGLPIPGLSPNEFAHRIWLF